MDWEDGEKLRVKWEPSNWQLAGFWLFALVFCVLVAWFIAPS